MTHAKVAEHDKIWKALPAATLQRALHIDVKILRLGSLLYLDLDGCIGYGKDALSCLVFGVLFFR